MSRMKKAGPQPVRFEYSAPARRASGGLRTARFAAAGRPAQAGGGKITA